MELREGVEVNEFKINDEVFVWEIESGVPVLVNYTVFSIKLYQGQIHYQLQDYSGEDYRAMVEHNIFSSESQAIQVFNESSDYYTLTRKG